MQAVGGHLNNYVKPKDNNKLLNNGRKMHAISPISWV